MASFSLCSTLILPSKTERGLSNIFISSCMFKIVWTFSAISKTMNHRRTCTHRAVFIHISKPSSSGFYHLDAELKDLRLLWMLSLIFVWTITHSKIRLKMQINCPFFPLAPLNIEIRGLVGPHMPVSQPSFQTSDEHCRGLKNTKFTLPESTHF